jgi:hypothetical protein
MRKNSFLLLLVLFVISSNNYAQMHLNTNYLGVSQSNVSSNQWHYVVVTKSSNLQGQMYLDGVLVRDTLWGNNSYSYSKFYIGTSLYTSFSGFFKGQIDELRISNKVRTQNEVQNYYNSNLPFSIDGNTFALFHFDENSGTVINNANGGSGSLQGCTYTTGKFGSSLNLDGISNYADCNISIPTSNITIEFWFKSNGTQNCTLVQPYGSFSSNIALSQSVTNPTASITASGPTTFCAGGNVTLTAQGTGTYLWSNGSTNQSISVSQSGNYSVTITNNGYSATSTATTITVNPNPIVSITASGPTTFCAGGNVTLTAQGIGTYLWSNGSTNQSVSATQSANYSLVITNNGCSATSTVTTITVNPNPIASISVSGPTIFCQGGNVTLTASGGGTYLWSNNASSSSINVSSSGVFSTTVTLNGCSSSSSKTITVNPNPIVSLASLSSFINNNSNSITLVGTPNGGIYIGSGVSGNSFNPQLSGLGNKTVTYNYTNSNNCSGSASSSTIVYDTTGVVCTSYDTTFITVTDTLIINAHFAGLNNTIGTTTIKIYPNPTSDIIYIHTGDFSSLSGSTIKITDVLGQTIFNSLINQQLFTINTTQFGARGTFIVQIIDANQVVKETRTIILN